MFRVLFLSLLLVVGCASDTEKNTMAEKVNSVREKAKDVKEKVVGAVEKLKKVKSAQSITCSATNDERTISNRKLETGGCEVVYNKFGSKKVIATAKNDLSYCTTVANRISTKLEGAGFSCK
jgi:hypothetical protein